MLFRSPDETDEEAEDLRCISPDAWADDIDWDDADIDESDSRNDDGDGDDDDDNDAFLYEAINDDRQ